MIRLFSVMGNCPFVMIPCLAHYACSRLSRKRKSSWPTTKSIDVCRLLHLDFVMSHFNSKYEDPNLGQSPIYSPQRHQACCVIIPDVSRCWRSVQDVRELHYHTLYMAIPLSMALIQRAQCVAWGHLVDEHSPPSNLHAPTIGHTLSLRLLLTKTSDSEPKFNESACANACPSSSCHRTGTCIQDLPQKEQLRLGSTPCNLLQLLQ
jgi:hypothetical protein